MTTGIKGIFYESAYTALVTDSSLLLRTRRQGYHNGADSSEVVEAGRGSVQACLLFPWALADGHVSALLRSALTRKSWLVLQRGDPGGVQTECPAEAPKIIAMEAEVRMVMKASGAFFSGSLLKTLPSARLEDSPQLPTLRPLIDRNNH